MQILKEEKIHGRSKMPKLVPSLMAYAPGFNLGQITTKLVP